MADVHVFHTEVQEQGNAFYERMHVLPVPAEISAAFGKAGTVRCHTELNGYAVDRCLIPNGMGGHYIWLGRDHLRAIGAQTGSTVHVRLWAADPHAVVLPPEFEAALEQDEAAAQRFYAFTPGKQRGLASYITQAKTEATRIKRSLDICQKLRDYQLYGDLNPDKR